MLSIYISNNAMILVSCVSNKLHAQQSAKQVISSSPVSMRWLITSRVPHSPLSPNLHKIFSCKSNSISICSRQNSCNVQASISTHTMLYYSLSLLPFMAAAKRRAVQRSYHVLNFTSKLYELFVKTGKHVWECCCCNILYLNHAYI